MLGLVARSGSGSLMAVAIGGCFRLATDGEVVGMDPDMRAKAICPVTESRTGPTERNYLPMGNVKLSYVVTDDEVPRGEPIHGGDIDWILKYGSVFKLELALDETNPDKPPQRIDLNQEWVTKLITRVVAAGLERVGVKPEEVLYRNHFGDGAVEKVYTQFFRNSADLCQIPISLVFFKNALKNGFVEDSFTEQWMQAQNWSRTAKRNENEAMLAKGGMPRAIEQFSRARGEPGPARHWATGASPRARIPIKAPGAIIKATVDTAGPECVARRPGKQVKRIGLTVNPARGFAEQHLDKYLRL
ncbi:hypothetical protein GNI_031520 [Gregarina niphandrodes]|uniref:Uncharacterized protein n=1 Tax=Gregarina niphandrodes TaxID=110365 RepID=A0A023BAY8_GRENI|nr:hypothetical protein GNI_031520 [Gregarina niphandrodes]EZG78860.1 hypothetical protein GNI_031520 [Gregarina niphandrodes]|eukprot:XP_011129168.1 hypothetical protein GNI_031520 [Gregarina niphandrodes]